MYVFIFQNSAGLRGVRRTDVPYIRLCHGTAQIQKENVNDIKYRARARKLHILLRNTAAVTGGRDPHPRLAAAHGLTQISYNIIIVNVFPAFVKSFLKFTPHHLCRRPGSRANFVQFPAYFG